MAAEFCLSNAYDWSERTLIERIAMNIVFIMTDAQCKDMVGAYGNPAMKTPHLDRLAAGWHSF